MELREVANGIKLGKVAPVYLFYGNETFLMNEMVALLEKQVVGSGEDQFLISRYDLNETPVQQVVEDAETFPFLGDRKLIIASNASFFTAVRDSDKVEHQLERLITYLEQPVDYSVVVFITTHNKIDERKSIVKTMKKAGISCSFAPLEGVQLQQWVIREGKQLGVEWEISAVSLLTELVGSSLQNLYQEIKKIAIYVGEKKIITREIVEELVSRSLDDNVFALTDFVSKVQMENAFRLLHDLLHQKEEPIKLVALLARQFRMMLHVKELSERGYGQQQMASTLGVHPYPIKLALETGQRYDMPTLKKIMTELAEIDYKMKTGQMEKVLLLELFFLQIQEWVKKT